MTGFTKVHGNGNDFVVLENLDGRYSTDDLARLARLLCRRNFSIGADGILVMEASRSCASKSCASKSCASKSGASKSDASVKADFVMRIFNSDGSESDMCGNGARALARYAFVKGLAGSPMCFTTLAGPMRATVESPYVELDMGEINLQSVLSGKLQSHGIEFPYVYLVAAISHCVLWVGGDAALDDAMKFKIGREVSRDFSRFPEEANVTFANETAPREVKAVTYELGVEDLTKSCGTGSVATAIALSLDKGYPSGSVSIRNPGGVNEVRLEFAPQKQACHAWLKGRTAIVAEGSVLDDALLE